MGSVMSLMTMAHSMGMLAGSLFAGLIMDFFVIRYAFPYGSLVMVAGGIIFAVCMYRNSSLSILKQGTE